MQKMPLSHALMDVVPESTPVAVVLAIALVIFGPPLCKLATAFWAPKVRRARLRIAQSVAPKETALSADNPHGQAIEEYRQRV
ncbi:hypothetical protein [Streptomyces sp. NRRL B-24572]|uniref:hypothetical protein n=1 Tax=Streptomyces sp. NRRL B-24572 TaxID=1962156 RepID=UPI000A3AF553|nr:hypothetical protein [Streptomyces sp. NRRL B-24572]